MVTQSFHEVAMQVRKEVLDDLSRKTPDELRALIATDGLLPRIVTRDGLTINVDFNLVDEGDSWVIEIFAGGSFVTQGSLDVTVQKGGPR